MLRLVRCKLRGRRLLLVTCDAGWLLRAVGLGSICLLFIFCLRHLYRFRRLLRCLCRLLLWLLCRCVFGLLLACVL